MLHSDHETGQSGSPSLNEVVRRHSEDSRSGIKKYFSSHGILRHMTITLRYDVELLVLGSD